MTKQKRKLPPMFLTACTFLFLGILGFFFTLFAVGATPSLKGFLLVSSSLIGFGIGEILNHPKVQIPQGTSNKENPAGDYYRRRSTCGLGNLMIIIAILLFFVGISSLIY